MSEPNDFSGLEAMLRSLMKGEFSSLTISFNDQNAPNYKSVGGHLEYYPDADEDAEWVSDEERVKAIETNSWWSAQWYPDTPVGFCSISASSLQALLAALAEIAASDDGAGA